MGWWSWAKPQPTSIAFPHAIVNLRVTQEALDLIQRGFGREPEGVNRAASGVLRSGPTPVSVLYFTDRSAITDNAAYEVAHEVSHLTARLLGIPDRTHEKDGGVA